MKNKMKLEFDSISANEGFARVAVASFITPLNPTLEEMEDVKTAVSEAVTNCIIHGYCNEYNEENKVYIECQTEKEHLKILIMDKGVGIENIEKAKQPLYTTKPELERSGMGFAFMEAFMDALSVESKIGEGTTIMMEKWFGRDAGKCDGQ